MKFTSAAVLAYAAFVLAAPAAAANDDKDCTTTAFHGHHKHKREVVYDYAYVTVTVDIKGNPIQTVEKISLSPESAAPATTQATTEAQTTKSPTTEAETTVEAETTAKPQTTQAQTTQQAETSQAQTQAPSTPQSSGGNGGISGDLAAFQNPTEQFQDGVLSCSSFPSGQGVVALDHLGFGGWSGIENADGSTGGNCKEGSYCSYACQSGMSKTQWPQSQPANGVSIGGLLCKGGKLYKSNSRSNYLCEWGVNKANVVNQLSQSVAICRTDYPGTENMVIPTVVGGGSSSPITVVDQSSYYTWRGGSTSAQYYVNNAGVDWTDGCVWGTPGSGIGNWAPLNFGAGYANGIAYLSLIPNPNNRSPLNFKVKIEAANGGAVSGQCTYDNGKYNGNGNDGCTVGVTAGSANFVLYN
ncbi:SUN family beta-glucosidase-like protein [Scheffersomyces xylosifermentans]|uniref:SUN family beta-glucosidase-like protein n=1 Tax=Scheffersomyces xylosifermentans TaxID=1304137 RepID=UPI00315DA81A